MTQQAEDATKRWVLALTSVASFMVALDALVVTMALGTIRVDLAASVEALEWVVNAYNLSFAVLLLTGAALGDRFGRRRMFAGGLALFVAASVACALAPSIGWLIAARAVQGVGAALIMPLAMALLSTAFAPQDRAKALGIFSGVTGLALIAGPIAGGAITAGAAWPWIFWINVPIGIVMLPLVFRCIGESRGANTALDIGGLMLVTAAAFAAVWGLMRADKAGWSSMEVIGSLAAAVILAVVFVRFEQRTQAAMVPMRLFGSRGFAAGNAVAFFLYASLYGSVFLLPLFLQLAQGHDALAAGLRLLPWTATLFVFAPLGGALVSRLGERRLIVTGLGLQAIGLAWIGQIATPTLPYAALVAPLIVAGAGVSIAMPAAQNAVLGAVAPIEIGKASGIFNMLRFLAGAFGIAILVAVFMASGDFTTAGAFAAGFRPAITLAAALSLAGAVAGLILPATRAQSAAAAQAKA